MPLFIYLAAAAVVVAAVVVPVGAAAHIAAAAAALIIFSDYRFLARKLDAFGVIACPLLTILTVIASGFGITVKGIINNLGVTVNEAMGSADSAMNDISDSTERRATARDVTTSNTSRKGFPFAETSSALPEIQFIFSSFKSFAVESTYLIFSQISASD